MQKPASKSACGCTSSDCHAEMARRDFLKLTGLAATGLALSNLPAMAGPFTRADFEKLVPADKKLHPDWVKSLFARGTRTVYRWPESQKIGMPIGGICAGQLYLGGDGKLWHWDIFNHVVGTGDGHYASPPLPASPLDQGFALKTTIGGQPQVRPLDHTGWKEITFNGEYPIGFVEYRDPGAPVQVSLEAFSPFIPLNPEDSALPATVMRFTIHNTSNQPVETELAGWLENAVCLHTAHVTAGQRRNRIVRRNGYAFLDCSAEALPTPPAPAKRPDIVFDDFERATYDRWTTTGTAFGAGPIETGKIPGYQGDVGAHGKRTVNSHATAPGGDVGAKDSATGTLTSKPFVIERNFITFLIGGGAHQGKTCVNLRIDDKVVLSATGKNDNRMQPHSLDVRRWAGQTARLQVVDDDSGGWGNIGLDDIVFSDESRAPSVVLNEQSDFGTMGLALLEEGSQRSDLKSQTIVASALSNPQTPADYFSTPAANDTPAAKSFGEKLVGALSRKLSLAAGQSATVTFAITWHFLNIKLSGLGDYDGRSYGQRFPNALAVADYVTQQFDRLTSQTRRWHDTWYDSTLPYWFLDRTMAPTSHLATNTCYWFGNGRFYAWEGVGCCAGTCTHVWHYAHAVARLFPPLERSLREVVDYGVGFDADTGRIRFRAEHNNHWAADGQSGCILRTYREHQMSGDDAFLRRLWPRVKKSIEFLMVKDTGNDGLLDGPQHNTLDADWWGHIAWLSGLYLSALRAGEEMAHEVGDEAFARQCASILEKGRRLLVEQLFDGEYFVNQINPQHLDAINSGTGCEIDQAHAQSWAFQVGLGRVLPEKETRSALQSLWRYNFTPDVGPYRNVNKPGRWYAMAGEAGLLMCTFPRTDWDYAKAAGKGPNWAAGYFNECMNGFEYQAAGHMIWEGLVKEGLAVTRAIHDRYHAARRNPWNEVECGDHYARSMAAYGVYLAACGYEHHGPKGHLGFAPRLTPEHFRAAFTTAESWGTFAQQFETAKLKAQIALKWGKLRLRTLALGLPRNFRPTQVTVTAAGKPVTATLAVKDGRATINLSDGIAMQEGDVMELLLA